MGGCGVYHVFVSRLCVPRVPWERRILVESVVFPTKSPPVTHGGAEISATGGWTAHNLDFQALSSPCSYEEIILCT